MRSRHMLVPPLFDKKRKSLIFGIHLDTGVVYFISVSFLALIKVMNSPSVCVHAGLHVSAHTHA